MTKVRSWLAQSVTCIGDGLMRPNAAGLRPLGAGEGAPVGAIVTDELRSILEVARRRACAFFAFLPRLSGLGEGMAEREAELSVGGVASGRRPRAADAGGP